MNGMSCLLATNTHQEAGESRAGSRRDKVKWDVGVGSESGLLWVMGCY